MCGSPKFEDVQKPFSDRKIERRGMDRVTGDISSRCANDGTNGKLAYHYRKSRFLTSLYSIPKSAIITKRVGHTFDQEIYSENSELISPEK